MITNAKVWHLTQALATINRDRYDGNISFKRIDPVSANRVRFTLTVNDSKGRGARRGFRVTKSGQRSRVKAGCWHAHGHFFEALFQVNPEAFVRSGKATITIDDGNWEDRNIGSIVVPLYFSEACDCNA